MNFNFEEGKSYVASSQQYLKAYTINEGKVTKFELTTMQGVKDPSVKYSVIAFEFTGTEKNPGVFTTNIFVPTNEDDAKRPTYTNADGHEYEGPSRAENFQYTILQIMQAVNMEGFTAKMKEFNGKSVTTKEFVSAALTVVKKGKDNVTNLKLVGKNVSGNVYASLPNSTCGIGKDGKLYFKKFIGDNLNFTSYEMQQSKSIKSATPTPMPKEEEDSGNELDDLLNDI